MAKPKPKLMIERGNSPRGLVPTQAVGRLDEPFNAYLDELEPRGTSERSESFRRALALSKDQRFLTFLDRLSQKRYQHYHLATIAKTCDIGLTEMADFWHHAQGQRTLVIAQEGAVKITRDMVSDAESIRDVCGRCDGLKKVGCESHDEGAFIAFMKESVDPDTGARKETPVFCRICPACDGVGKVNKPGDENARNKILEMVGLIGKKGGAMVQINQSFGGQDINSAVGRLDQITFNIEPQEVE